MGGGTSTGEFSMGYTFPRERILEISTPYLLVKGDVSTGDYKLIQYATEDEAREKQIKDKGLVKILKAVPIEQIGVEDAKKISGYAVHRVIDKGNNLFTILSEEGIFLGSNIKTSLVNAVEKKEKYTTNLNGEKNPVYGMFRDDQIIISALIPVE